MTMEIFKGWPYGGAIDNNGKPKASEDIVAGMFVKRNPADNEWIKATGAAGEHAEFALQDQSDYDVIAAQKLPTIMQNALVGTDQYTPGTYAINADLEVDSANHGKVKIHAGGSAPVVAVSKGIVDRDGISFLKMQLP